MSSIGLAAHYLAYSIFARLASRLVVRLAVLMDFAHNWRALGETVREQIVLSAFCGSKQTGGALPFALPGARPAPAHFSRPIRLLDSQRARSMTIN